MFHQQVQNPPRMRKSTAADHSQNLLNLLLPRSDASHTPPRPFSPWRSLPAYHGGSSSSHVTSTFHNPLLIPHIRPASRPLHLLTRHHRSLFLTKPYLHLFHQRHRHIPRPFRLREPTILMDPYLPRRSSPPTPAENDALLQMGHRPPDPRTGRLPRHHPHVDRRQRSNHARIQTMATLPPARE